MLNIIHIRWHGPFSPQQVCEGNYNLDSRKGLYQVYSYHPVYGQALVYIGRTIRSFESRIAAEGWLKPGEADPNNIDVYLGCLVGDPTPSEDIWANQIDLAEALLIHSHAPAYNSTYIFNPPKADAVKDIIIRNHGASRSLAREVSGAVWSSAAVEALRLSVYKSPILQTEEPLPDEA